MATFLNPNMQGSFPVLFHGKIWLLLNALWFIVGVVFLGWSPEVVILAYIFETAVIGGLTVFKMLWVLFFGEAQQRALNEDVWGNFSDAEREKIGKRGVRFFGYLFFGLVIAMFTIVFFGFVWGQSIFIFLIMSKSNEAISGNLESFWPNLTYLFSLSGMRQAFAGIVISNLLYTIQQFFLERKYCSTTINELFVTPWVRIFIQQILAILGGWVFYTTSSGVVGVAVLLIVMKTAAELYYDEAIIKKLFPEKKN